MKKLFAIIGAMVALAACNNSIIEEPAAPVSDGHGIKVNLTITRGDAFDASPDTKATVKKAWADGDVVFIFFNGVAAPKYMEMKYSDGSWISTPKNDLSASDLGASGTMTAVYLPYGNDAVVAADGNEFIFKGIAYTGVFLQDEQAEYVYDEELTGELTMEAPAPEDSDERFVHFDVSGYTDGNTYALFQDYVKPVVFNSVLPSGKISFSEGEAGKAIVGYIDATNEIVSFSGILDASAVGTAVDYQFSVNDETASVLYTRDAGKKTLSSSKYIGLGDLSGEKWIATEYVYMGFDTPSGEKLCWATKNLGATSADALGNYYAWMKTDGHAAVKKENPFYAEYDYEIDYEFSFDSYENNENDGDPASFALKGLWRMPTEKEFSALINSTSQSYSEDSNRVGMMTFTSSISGYSDRSLFFPAGEFFDADDSSGFGDFIFGDESGTSLNGPLENGYYWSSSPDSHYDDEAYSLFFNNAGTAYTYYTYDKYCGMLVRPVFSLETLDASTVDIPESDLNGHDFVKMGDGLKWATMNVGATSPTGTGDYFAWGETDPYYATFNPLTWKNGKEAGYVFSSYFDYLELDTFEKYYKGEGGLTRLESGDDAANFVFEGTWRTPTCDEWAALCNTDNYTWEWTDNYENTGVKGIVVTSKVSGFVGNSIFLPVTGRIDGKNIINGSLGFYWSSDLLNSSQVRPLGFSDTAHSIEDRQVNRCIGMAIRAVSE